jgi:hypothetical protein
MRARRRFHGYCPPASRRASDNIMLGSPDDYTSTMSGMTVHVVNSTTNPLNEIVFAREEITPIHSFDQDDDTSVIGLLEANRDLQLAVLGIRRRNLKRTDGLKTTGMSSIVTSLSFDGRDDILIKKSPPRKELLSIHRALLSASNEEDERYDVSDRSESDVAGTSLVETPDSASVASAVSTIGNENEVVATVEGKPSERAFLAFRMNYLIVTVAIMLADGLQGKLNNDQKIPRLLIFSPGGSLLRKSSLTYYGATCLFNFLRTESLILTNFLLY